MIQKFSVTNQNLEKTEVIPTVRGTNKYIYCQFDFMTDDWNECIVKAIFEAPESHKTYEQVLRDGMCIVPYEVAKEAGYIKVSLEGTTGAYTITSDSTRFRSKDTLDNGENAMDPTPTVFEQFVASVKDDANRAEEAAGKAEQSAERAEQSAAQSGYMDFHIDEAGHLIYGRTNNVNIEFGIIDGRLVILE